MFMLRQHLNKVVLEGLNFGMLACFMKGVHLSKWEQELRQ